MKVRGKLTIKAENAGEMISVIARSLSPDNVSGIRTEVDKDSVTVTFSANKIGTMLSSVDDYLMNANIAFSLSYIKKQDNQTYSQVLKKP
jgi:hypothetical protein